jgi:hypothetical protein
MGKDMAKHLSAEAIAWLTVKATKRMKQIITKEKSFYEDGHIDEWICYKLPKRFGGEEVEVNYFVYGSPYLHATAYTFHTYEHNGQSVTEMDTSSWVELKKYKIRLKANQQ